MSGHKYNGHLTQDMALKKRSDGLTTPAVVAHTQHCFGHNRVNGVNVKVHGHRDGPATAAYALTVHSISAAEREASEARRLRDRTMTVEVCGQITIRQLETLVMGLQFDQVSAILDTHNEETQRDCAGCGACQIGKQLRSPRSQMRAYEGERRTGRGQN